MSTPAPTMYDVFEEIDDLVYTFEGDAALAAWSLDGEATYVSVRPATPADVVDMAELEAMLTQGGPAER